MKITTRGAVFGAACAICAIVAVGSAAAQTYPPGTNCLSLLPGGLRSACIDQARQAGSTTTTIPNSGVGAPGSLNSGTTVTPGTAGPNSVTPNGTGNPNAVTPNSTINPNTVRMPNQAPAPATGNQIIIPQTVPNTGTGTDGSAGSGTGATGGTGTGTSGN
jgi:hypothetical protein